jgi:hypothetical protein
LKKKLWAGLGSAALAALAVAAVALATPANVSRAYSMKVTAKIDSVAASCSNQGSTVELSGSLLVQGLGVKLQFQNNVKGTHTLQTVGEASLAVAPLGTVTIPKQPVLGGVGGNPNISLQFVDGAGNSLSDEIPLGRCVQGLSLPSIVRDLAVSAGANALLSTLSCSNKGTSISLQAGRTSGAVGAKLIFRNADNPVGGPHQAAADATVTLDLLSGATVTKKGSLGGVGGNPLINLLFTDEQGNAIGDWYSLGRCVQLSK